jgi:ferredoxin-fold anticodon binding domain-containing protein
MSSTHEENKEFNITVYKYEENKHFKREVHLIITNIICTSQKTNFFSIT